MEENITTKVQEDEVLDIVVRLLTDMGHTGIMEKVYNSYQTSKWMEKLLKHPAYQLALERRQISYWNLMEQTAKKVDSWPDWKKNSCSNLEPKKS